MKTGYLLLLSVLCGALAGLLPVASRAADDSVPVTKNKESIQTRPAPAATATAEANSPQLSAGLDDIVKLSKSGIEESIILSFIKCSQVAYHPTAQELIKLRELGVSATAIEALILRGEEVRQRAAEAQKSQAKPAPAHATTQPTPQVASPPEPTRVDSATAAAYSAATTNVVYVPSYYSPYYYGYYPSYSIGFGFGYGCYPYGYYGGSYYYGDCHGGSYHVGPYGSYNGSKSGYVSSSPNASKSGGVNRGAYQAGYSGARQSSYGGGTYGGSTGGYKSGYSGGSYGGYRGSSQSAVYRGGYQGGARGGYVGGARGGFGGGGYRGK